MITDFRPLVEINHQAIQLLYQELGVIDAVRFLNQFTKGYGNYTDERDSIIGDKSLDEILDDIAKSRKST